MKKIFSFIREHQMIQRGDHVLAAVSGGADSVCLLLALMELQKEMPMEVSAVHVEHGIRGEESRADAEFVEDLCREQGICCDVFHCDAVSYARERGIGLEEGARELRYGIFESCRQERKADKIAVAHSQNDCAETALFHMARGTGVRGLCGIAPVRGEVIRPLLCASRREIEAILQGRGQAWRTDSTNGELCYSRNRIRHEALPSLVEVNAAAVEHICQAAQAMAEAWEVVERQSSIAWERWVRERHIGAYFLDEGVQQELPLIGRTLAMELLARCIGSRKDLTSVHVAALMGLFGHQVGRRICLPHGAQALRTYGGVELLGPERDGVGLPPSERDGMGLLSSECDGMGFLPSESDGMGLPPRWGDGCACSLPLAVGEKQAIWGSGLTVVSRLMEKKGKFEEIPQKKYTKWFDYDKIKSSLLLRNPQPGDYLTIDREGRTQSLRRYFINEKVPLGQRGSQLVLADGTHVLWAVGRRISECYKVTADTARILEVRINGGRIHE